MSTLLDLRAAEAAIARLLLACMLLVGCNSDDPGANGTSTRNSAEMLTPATNHNVGAGQRRLFEGWPTPAVTLVLTGEQQGYLEPCGCTDGQSGGISRRADLIHRLADEKGWPLTAFDLGGTVRRNRRQSEIKFETMLAALKDMRYTALGLGPAELRFGPEFLLAMQPFKEESPETSLTFLGANIVLFNDPEIGTPTRWKVLTVGGKKIGVTAVLGKREQSELLPKGTNVQISMQAAEEALPPVVEQLQAENLDLLVLLSYSSLEESTALAQMFPAFDLIVSAGGPEDPDGQPIAVGQTMLVNVGQKGKHVGVVGLFPDDAEHRLRFELVELEKSRFQDTPKMVEHMRAYQIRLREEEIVKTELSINHPSGAEFVGAEACGECHTKAFEKWKKTPHFGAFESLKQARKGDKDYGITRIYDPECLACHVTGWHPQEVLRYDTGFLNAEFATNPDDKEHSLLLKGQQCESCHGPGSRHIELVGDGKKEEAGQLMWVSLDEAEEKMCAGCHDPDNSPHFEFKRYWSRVIHRGLN